MAIESTWETRDLPVLEATVKALNNLAHPGPVTIGQIGEIMGREVQEVYSALSTMEDEYITLKKFLTGGDPTSYYVTGVTPKARRAVGQWPSVETLADTFITALKDAEENESNSERKSKLRTARNAVLNIGQDVLVAVLSTVATKGIGL